MTISFTQQAERSYQRLPFTIQKKVDKQFSLLLADYRHPSLRTRKMSGEDRFEARIDRKHRFTFLIEEDTIHILTMGPHDIGLGKK